MDKIVILDIDSKLPNLALLKIEKYHLLRKDIVVWNDYLQIENADRVYASCIFTKNKPKIDGLSQLDKASIGGSGYSLDIKLPTEIENMNIRRNFGFTTRGCIRYCEFCIVHKKEGGIREYGDIYDIWDGCSMVVKLLDNNILALPSHFETICKQLAERNLSVDFNQGLDIRLVTREIAHLLVNLKYTRDISFSVDSVKTLAAYQRGMKLLREAGFRWNSITTFLLVGFDSTLEEDLERIEVIKSYGSRPFVMKFQGFNEVKPKVDRNQYELQELARWTNQPHGFYKLISFRDWISHKKLAARRCSQEVMDFSPSFERKGER